MKEDTDAMNEKVQHFYKEWKQVLDEAISDYSKTAAKPDYTQRLSGKLDQREALWRDMKALVSEINKGKKFTNPF